MSLIKVCKAGDIPVGGMQRFLLDENTPVAIYHVGDAFYATSDNCTHGTASLSEGDLCGEIIECPFHSGSFNCRTGAPVDAPCSIPLQCYAVEIKGDDLFVDAL